MTLTASTIFSAGSPQTPTLLFVSDGIEKVKLYEPETPQSTTVVTTTYNASNQPLTNTITRIINKIVPFMTGLFLIVCIYGLIIKFNYIDDVLMLIIKDAFTVKSGFISVVILGLKRSLFSNEAGLGTAPSINSYSDNTPIKQGYLQVLTCFIDTIIMCILLENNLLVEINAHLSVIIRS